MERSNKRIIFCLLIVLFFTSVSFVYADSVLLLKGDVNKDEKVDVLDLNVIEESFGATPEEENWNPDADITNDSKIDVFDLAAVGKEVKVASIGCWDCDNRNYESADRENHCECDEWEKCKDYFIKSTAYNFDKGYMESKTDVCVSDSILREYYLDCWGEDSIEYTDKDCNDYDSYGEWEYYCTSSQVRKRRYLKDYGCSQGSCKLIFEGWVDDQLISSRGYSDYCEKRKEYGCSLCEWGESDCDSDDECSGALICIGPYGDFFPSDYDGCCSSDEEWDPDNKKCLCRPHWYYKCWNDDVWWYSKCNEREDKKEECGDDTYSSWVYYCQSDDRWRKRFFYDRGCSNSACFVATSLQNELYQDCGESGYEGVEYCSNDDVYRDYVHRGCIEDSCYSDIEKVKQKECGNDYCGSWNYYCDGNKAYKKRTCHDRGCSGNSCFDKTYEEKVLVEDCGKAKYCSSGSCQSCSSGKANCNQKSSDGCEVNLLTDNNNCGSCGNVCGSGEKCQNGNCVAISCYKDSDCGTDGWVNEPYCSEDDVYQTWRVWKCNNPGQTGAYCSHSDTPKLKQDCGEDSCGAFGSNYCKDNDVYKRRTCYKRGCSEGACFTEPWIDEQKVQECGTAGCSNAQCNKPPIVCYKDSDCGTDGWVNEPYCSTFGDVLQYWRIHTCNNPGTQEAFCSYKHEVRTKEDCGTGYCKLFGNNYCKNGDIYHSRICYDEGCSNAKCYSDPYIDEELVKDCKENCSNGYCSMTIDLPEGTSIFSCLLYTSPSPRDLSTSRMPSSA